MVIDRMIARDALAKLHGDEPVTREERKTILRLFASYERWRKEVSNPTPTRHGPRRSDAKWRAVLFARALIEKRGAGVGDAVKAATPRADAKTRAAITRTLSDVRAGRRKVSPAFAKEFGPTTKELAAVRLRHRSPR